MEFRDVNSKVVCEVAKVHHGNGCSATTSMKSVGLGVLVTMVGIQQLSVGLGVSFKVVGIQQLSVRLGVLVTMVGIQQLHPHTHTASHTLRHACLH